MPLRYIPLLLSLLFTLTPITASAECTEALAPTTSAASSNVILPVFNRGSYTTVVVSPIGALTIGEDTHIEFSIDGGTTWEDLYDGGSQVILDEQTNVYIITGAGRYRATKGTSVGAVGIYECTYNAY